MALLDGNTHTALARMESRIINENITASDAIADNPDSTPESTRKNYNYIKAKIGLSIKRQTDATKQTMLDQEAADKAEQAAFEAQILAQQKSVEESNARDRKTAAASAKAGEISQAVIPEAPAATTTAAPAATGVTKIS